MNPGPRAALLGCACAALALSACGSSSSSSSSSSDSSPASTPTSPASTPTSPASPPAAASGTAPGGSSAGSKLAVQADPTGRLAYVEKSLTAKAGKVTIAFTNPSSVPHDIAVEQAGKQLGVTPVINGGSNSLALTLARGTYTFFCTVDSHRAAGMVGTLTVG